MNTTHTLRVGVIGAGRIGQVHAEHLAQRISGVELVAIADTRLDAAETCASKLHIPQCWGDPAHVIEDPGIDAVVICSSTDTHSSLIEAAANAGKHIFCEKPIDFDLNRIGQALAAVEKAGVKLQIGFNRRFDPSFQHIHDTVRAGGVGTPHIIRITSRDPAPPPIEYVKVSGGIFLDMSIHDFDMARYMAGSEVTTVYAAGAVNVDPRIGEAGDIDTAVVTLTFENGVIATIDNSRQAVYGYDQRVEVFGSEGVIWADNSTAYRTVHGTRDGMKGPLPLHFFMDRYIDSYIIEMNTFIDCVRQDLVPPVTGRDGCAPVVIGLAAKRSLDENRPVAVKEITA